MQQDPLTLDNNRKSQLDSNIKKMLDSGASNDDVMSYASDFKNKFGVKKKDNLEPVAPTGTQTSNRGSFPSQTQVDTKFAIQESVDKFRGGTDGYNLDDIKGGNNVYAGIGQTPSVLTDKGKVGYEQEIAKPRPKEKPILDFSAIKNSPKPRDAYYQDPTIAAREEKARLKQLQKNYEAGKLDRNTFTQDLDLVAASGIDMLGRMASTIPSGILDNAIQAFGNQPGGLVSMGIDAEVLGKIAEKKLGLPEEYNPLSPNNALAETFRKKAELNQSLSRKGYSGGITDALKLGEYKDAAKLLAFGFTESLPILLGLAATRGSGMSSTGSLISTGLGTQATTYQDLKTENPEIAKNILFLNATLTGIGEAGSEVTGTNLLYNQARKLFVKGQKEQAKEIVTKGIKEYLDYAFQKSFVGSAVLGDMSGEVANQIWKNATDKWSGVRPDVDYLDGVGDAALISAFTTSTIAAGAKSLAAIVNPKTKDKIDDTSLKISNLQKEADNPDMPDAARTVIVNEIGNLTESINEDLKKDNVQYNDLDDDQKTTVDNLSDKRDEIKSALNNAAVSDETKQVLQKQLNDIDLQIESILSTKPTPEQKLETPKPQEDAIQVETAGQVPVLTEAPVGEEVEQGKPEPKAKVIAEEGAKAEEVGGVDGNVVTQKLKSDGYDIGDGITIKNESGNDGSISVTQFRFEKDGKKIGHLRTRDAKSFFKDEKEFPFNDADYYVVDDGVSEKGVEIYDENLRNKGVGTKMYESAQEYLQKQNPNARLISSSQYGQTKASYKLWKKLYKDGKAEIIYKQPESGNLKYGDDVGRDFGRGEGDANGVIYDGNIYALKPKSQLTKSPTQEQTPAQEVKQLRAEEQAELNAAIPNADQYKTNGKVDRAKITDAKDLKKFDDIYDKYDKLITPLLPKKEAKAEVDIKQQIENFGVAKDQVEPVNNVISQVFDGLKKAGLTTAKNVSEWVGIGKGSKLKNALFQPDNSIEVEKSEIIQKSKANGTYLKAPNGKKSNLNESQWVTVRTNNFKKWFGDWENDPKNASKVVDKNGEPLVVYHGSKTSDIKEFNRRESERISSGLKENGIYFTSNKKLAEFYQSKTILKPDVLAEINQKIKSLYNLQINSRNNKEYNQINQEIERLTASRDGKVYEAFLNLKDIAEFDAKGKENMEAWNELSVKASYKTATNRDALDFLKEGRFGVEKVDGVKAKNIVDAFVQGNDRLRNELIGDAYLVFDDVKSAVKSATDNSGEFSSNTENILYSKDGSKEQAQYRIQNGKNIVEALKDFDGSPKAVVAITHEIMHPTLVAIIDGAKEGNEVGVKHTQTMLKEFNKANPENKVTFKELIDGNDAFRNGKTTKQYRSVQEFIAESWEKYHTEGGKGFSKAFQEVLAQITEAFKSVYKSISGKKLTPELTKMFDEILGKEPVKESKLNESNVENAIKPIADLKQDVKKAKGKEAKATALQTLKENSTPEDFKEFIDENPLYKKYEVKAEPIIEQEITDDTEIELPTDKKDISKDRLAELEKQKKELFAKIRKAGSNLNTGFSPEVISDLVKLGAVYIEEAIINLKNINFSEFSAKLKNDYGKDIPEDIIRDIFRKSALANGVGVRRTPERIGSGEAVSDNLKEVANETDALYQTQNYKEIQDRLDSMSEADKNTLVGTLANVTGQLNAEGNVGVLAAIDLINMYEANGDKAGAKRVFDTISKSATAFAQLLRQYGQLKSSTPQGYVSIIEKHMLDKYDVKLTDVQKQAIEKLYNDSKKAIDIEADALNNLVDDLTDVNYKLWGQTTVLLEDANRRLSDYIESLKPATAQILFQKLTSIVQGDLLTLKSLLVNPVSNAAQAGIKLSGNEVANLFDFIINTTLKTGRTKISGFDPLAIRLGGKAFTRGLSKANRMLIKGATATDLAKIDVAGRLKPVEAWKSLYKTLRGKQAFEFVKTIENLAEGTIGVPANLLLRLLPYGDLPRNEQVKVAKLIEIGRNKFGLKGNQLEAFTLKPDPESLTEAELEGDKSTLQESNKVYRTINDLINSIDSKGDDKFVKGLLSGIKFIIRATQAPFLKTPINYAFKTIRFTNPIIPYSQAVYHMVKAIQSAKNIKNPLLRESAIRKHQSKLTEYLGEAVIAQSIMSAALILIGNGLVTGSAPEEDKYSRERNLMFQSVGPNMINISGLKRLLTGGDPTYKPEDTAIAYNALGILGAQLGISSNTLTKKEKENIREKKFITTEGKPFYEEDKGFYLTSIVDMLANLPASLNYTLNQGFAQGTGTLLASISDNEYSKWSDQMVKTLVTGLAVPNTVYQSFKAGNDYYRDVYTKDQVEEWANIVQERYGNLEGLPIKYDMFGKPIKLTPEGSNPYVYNVLDIFRTQKILQNKNIYYVFDLYKKTGDMSVIPNSVKDIIDEEGGLYTKLTPDQQSELQRIVGEERAKYLNGDRGGSLSLKNYDPTNNSEVYWEKQAKKLKSANKLGLKSGKRRFEKEILNKTKK